MAVHRSSRARRTLTIVPLAAVLAGGVFLIYGVMALLGPVVIHSARSVDRTVYNWTAAHRVHLWVSVMRRLTTLGDPPIARAAAVVAGVCLAASSGRRRWLPPLVLGLLVVVEAVLTPAIQHTVHHVGPPGTHEVATWPSGGCGRVIAFYGLIAYLLWREHSGRRSTGVWAAAAVVALAFNEAYSRAYLTVHWFTDVPSGCVYGVLMLVLMVTAVRFIVGPATSRSAPAYHRTLTPTIEHAAREVI